MRSMLYKYRHRDNKDFYVCSLAVIKKAFKKCLESLKSMNTQSGGSLPINDNTMVKLKNKLTKINKNIIVNYYYNVFIIPYSAKV